MANPHVDFVQIGTTFSRGPVSGTDWIDTGIPLPEENFEALIGQIGQFRTGIFQESRLAALDPIDEASPLTESQRLPLSQIGVSGFGALAVYLGKGPVTQGASRGTLYVSGASLNPFRVQLFTLKAVDIAFDDLSAMAMVRLLPEPTEAARGYYIRQSQDGETYEAVSAAPPTPPGPADGDITAGDFRQRFPTSLTAKTDAEVQARIAEAYRLSDVSRDATLYMLGHLLVLDGLASDSPDGGSQVIASEQQGPLRNTYRTMSELGGDRNVWLEQTWFGRQCMFHEARSPTMGFPVLIAGVSA